jgi:hypothetical protein
MEYKFKIKAVILWERIAGKPFAIENTEDLYLYLYAVKCVTDDNYSQSFDELLDECDKDASIIQDFLKQLENHNKRQLNLKKN